MLEVVEPSCQRHFHGETRAIHRHGDIRVDETEELSDGDDWQGTLPRPWQLLQEYSEIVVECCRMVLQRPPVLLPWSILPHHL